MRLKKITIRWQSCELATDIPFGCELEFECHVDKPENAYRKAITAMRTCLIAEGAQIDTALLETLEVDES